MRTRQCARNKDLQELRVYPSSSFFVLFLYALFLLPAVSECDETIILKIILNNESKGEFFVTLTDDHDFLVRTADLKAAGLRDPEGTVTEISGEAFISLRSVKGVEFTFNEKTLSLEIVVPPAMLPSRSVDFMPQRQPNVYYPKDSSAFLNYRFFYSAGNSFDFQSFNATSEIGIRTGDLLFLSDSSYAKTPGDSQFVRLMSSLIYDRRKEMQRGVLGDFLATSGDLGSAVTLGGLSFSKVYRMDPYFINRPMFSLTGFVSLPSDIEVNLDGMRILTGKFSPGQFNLRDISSYGGAGLVEIVIKDSFGREQRLRYPFYFTDILLREGLHEYSYNIGFIRKDFGVESNHYTKPAFLAFHRYGISDSLTAGLRAEGTEGKCNLGPQASYNIENAGIVSLSLSGSRNDAGKNGLAGSLNYQYQGKVWNMQFLVRGFTRDYTTIGAEDIQEKPRYETDISVGYTTKNLGSLSLDYAVLNHYEGQNRKIVAATYTKSLSGKVSAYATFRNVKERESSNEVFFGIIYYPGKDTSVSASYQKANGVNSEVLQVQKNPPVGEGVGFRASVERADSPEVSANIVNPFLQYNSRYGIYTAEYRGQFEKGRTSETYQFSASGGIVFLDRTLGVSRPIDDSFGLVKVANLEGIRVYQNNQEIGRTDATGSVLVPDFSSYYDNQVSINDKDIPINYSLHEIVKYVSPPLRSGSIISFDVAKFQAVTGKLSSLRNGQVRPAEFHEVRMRVGDQEITFPTGKDGEFYLENVKAGTYRASFKDGEKPCTFDIIIPETDEMIIDLGRVTCETVR